MLLSLLSAQRSQTLHLLDVKFMDLTFSKVTFKIMDMVKQTRPGYHLKDIVLTGYAPDRRLCIITVLKEYLSRTLDIRGRETKLLLCTVAPHKQASRQTISKWVRQVLKDAGIDTSKFAPHSTRAAATSAAARAHVPIDTILKTAGWSKDSMFRKYYEKPVNVDTGFTQALLCK